jgi:hypothetical protein
MISTHPTLEDSKSEVDFIFEKNDVSEAELLSFSIAQSAEMIFERTRRPPGPAPALISIRAQLSPASLLYLHSPGTTEGW